MTGVFPGAVRSTPKTPTIPALSLPATLKLALPDDLPTSASWRSLLEELMQEIEVALTRTATRARALLWQTAGRPPKRERQAGAHKSCRMAARVSRSRPTSGRSWLRLPARIRTSSSGRFLTNSSKKLF